jgi:hypothetical protein
MFAPSRDAVRDGLKKATPEQQQKLFHGIIRRVTYRDKEADIEFTVPVDDAQYCKEQQRDAYSFILLKIKRGRMTRPTWHHLYRRARQIGTCPNLLRQENASLRGLAKKTEKLIAFARTLLAELHPMTLRQLHYAIFSAAKIAYENTQADYKRLSRATTLARRTHRWGELHGLQVIGGIPHEWIIDELREAEMVSLWDNVAGYMDTVKHSYRRNNW